MNSVTSKASSEEGSSLIPRSLCRPESYSFCSWLRIKIAVGKILTIPEKLLIETTFPKSFAVEGVADAEKGNHLIVFDVKDGKAIDFVFILNRILIIAVDGEEDY